MTLEPIRGLILDSGMNREKQHGPYRSGKLATLCGVSADTIRHYEKLGLLTKPVRSQGGYRLYPENALVRVQTIRSSLKAGFRLAELAEIFNERDAGGAPCKRVAALAAQKIELLEAENRRTLRTLCLASSHAR